MGERRAFLLRMPPEVLDALQRWASDELRSVNAQVEQVLRDALRRAGRLPAGSRSDRMAEDPPAGDGGAVDPTQGKEEG